MQGGERKRTSSSIREKDTSEVSESLGESTGGGETVGSLRRKRVAASGKKVSFAYFTSETKKEGALTKTELVRTPFDLKGRAIEGEISSERREKRELDDEEERKNDSRDRGRFP